MILSWINQPFLNLIFSLRCLHRIFIFEVIAKYTDEINRIAVKWTRNGPGKINFTSFHYMPWILINHVFCPEVLIRKHHGPYGPRARGMGEGGARSQISINLVIFSQISMFLTPFSQISILNHCFNSKKTSSQWIWYLFLKSQCFNPISQISTENHFLNSMIF